MQDLILMDLCLDLFDGAAGTSGAAGAGSGAGQGEAQSSPASTRRGNSGAQTVYGKQAAAQTPPDAGEDGREPETRTASDTKEERRRAYRDLVHGEYKDFYTEDTQRIIDRRFRETKRLEQLVGQYQPIIDQLMQRYQVRDAEGLAGAIENDERYWSEAAEEAGMSVEQFKKFQKLQRENAGLLRAEQARRGQAQAEAQYQNWLRETEQARARYPDLDLRQEARNPQFLSMLRAGVPVLHAYEVMHMDEIKAAAAASQAKATEKQITDSIRAKGARPQENGAAPSAGFTVKDDVSKLTRKDRAEIARRAARGEIITF